MLKGKLENYLGLAKRSNSIVYGFENIKSNDCYAVLIGGDCKEKLEMHIKNVCNIRNIKYRKLNKSLNELFKTNNCSVIGIVNKNFIQPILESEE